MRRYRREGYRVGREAIGADESGRSKKGGGIHTGTTLNSGMGWDYYCCCLCYCCCWRKVDICSLDLLSCTVQSTECLDYIISMFVMFLFCRENHEIMKKRWREQEGKHTVFWKLMSILTSLTKADWNQKRERNDKRERGRDGKKIRGRDSKRIRGDTWWGLSDREN